DDLGSTSVWYVLHIDAGFQFQQFASDVGDVSEPDGTIVERARMGFGIGNERRQGLGRTCRIYNHDFIALDKPCDWRQSREHVEIADAGDGGKNHECARISKQEGVAVRLGCCDGLVANHAGRAGAILNDDRVTQHFAEALRNDSAHRVDWPARGVRHNRLDSAVRIGLGRTGARSRDNKRGRDSRSPPLCHDGPHLQRRRNSSMPTRYGVDTTSPETSVGVAGGTFVRRRQRFEMGARNLWRWTPMSTIPCSFRYSAF